MAAEIVRLRAAGPDATYSGTRIGSLSKSVPKTQIGGGCGTTKGSLETWWAAGKNHPVRCSPVDLSAVNNTLRHTAARFYSSDGSETDING
jgi:hypothetical protein